MHTAAEGRAQPQASEDAAKSGRWGRPPARLSRASIPASSWLTPQDPELTHETCLTPTSL